MKIALLHCYSSANSGDGLLVKEAIQLLHEALGTNHKITIFATYPETFRELNLPLVQTRPTWRGYHWSYMVELLNIRSYDLVVGVGGGYLRFGGLSEASKALAIHGPQLLGAALLAKRAVYLPQSIGPSKGGLTWILRSVLSKMDRVYVRDDRSLDEYAEAELCRAPDLALLGKDKQIRDAASVSLQPVLSLRSVRGSVPKGAIRLAELLRPLSFAGYIQSRGAGNDDFGAMQSINPATFLERDELLDSGERRVVVAVRLHAALMALNAGHYVIHLAYERKGFGAFQDLGLTRYVHNVFRFDEQKVYEQVLSLLRSRNAREGYDAILDRSIPSLIARRNDLVEEIRILSTAPG